MEHLFSTLLRFIFVYASKTATRKLPRAASQPFQLSFFGIIPVFGRIGGKGHLCRFARNSFNLCICGHVCILTYRRPLRNQNVYLLAVFVSHSVGIYDFLIYESLSRRSFSGDGKALPYSDSSLSVTPFHGAQIIFHLLAGASGFGKPTPRRGARVARLPLPEFFRPLTGASVFG